jgi:transcriptional regulator with PAS, ATPase and Fis domain
LIAKSIHHFSARRLRPLVAVNCAALPETLLESELFGHEKGAFTGAHERRIGKFEVANHGILFLDELGEISPSAQAKLLRALQEGEIQRVGGNKVIKVDVRVIAATNKKLADEVANGNFRQDLYYRLRVIEIELPPLRQRPDDIPVLAQYFLKQLRGKFPSNVQKISPEALAALQRYPFPGNVRELRNVIERGLVFAQGDTLLPQHLPAEVHASSDGLGGLNDNLVPTIAVLPGSANEESMAPQLDDDGEPLTLSDLERRHILYVLDRVGGNKLKAAGLLGISRTTLYEKLKTYDTPAPVAE